MPSAVKVRIDPDAMFVIASGFTLDLNGVPSAFCPKVGTVWKASHPGIRFWLENDGIAKGYIVASEEADEAALQMAKARAEVFPLPPEPEAAPAAPVALMRCVAAIRYLAAYAPGKQAFTLPPGAPPIPVIPGPPVQVWRFAEVGALLPADDEAVRLFPGSFEPAPQEVSDV